MADEVYGVFIIILVVVSPSVFIEHERREVEDNASQRISITHSRHTG